MKLNYGWIIPLENGISYGNLFPSILLKNVASAGIYDSNCASSDFFQANNNLAQTYSIVDIINRQGRFIDSLHLQFSHMTQKFTVKEDVLTTNTIRVEWEIPVVRKTLCSGRKRFRKVFIAFTGCKLFPSG